ncbi:MAG: UvrD-helicase domain-containing protein [Blautia sp.]
MGVNWTPEQRQVIQLRDRNILVSAAAGSGKTAVLVERILQMITDERRPVDIDRLLIMTFTRAAAGEMRIRLEQALSQKLEQDPGNEYLQRQSTLLHNAQITTIDGFCSYLIRNYFHTIGLDPGYRTVDEGELKLLRMDVAREVLEEFYARRDERYEAFVECLREER